MGSVATHPAKMAPEYFPFKIGCEMREKRTKRWTSARNIELYGTKSAECHGLPGIEVASHIRWNVSIHGRMRETITIQVQWSTAQAARKEVLKTIVSAHVSLRNAS